VESDPGRALSQYDETYYRCHCGHIPYERSDYWLRFFHAIADQIVRAFRPRRVLDAGCAKGFLVEALWERGVEAYGIDISEYAIGEVRQDMRAYCRQSSLASPIEGQFDLITCFEVLEHMTEEEALAAIRNLTAATDAILFSSSPTDLIEPTHVNVRPTISWMHAFADAGFAPDLRFDATFIAPHAFLLRRTAERPPEDVMVVYSELIRYRLVLADRQRRIDHLDNERARLQSAKDAAESELATVNHQAHLLRTERHAQEQALAERNAEIARLAQEAHENSLRAAWETQVQELRNSVRQMADQSERERDSVLADVARTVSGLDTKADRLALRLAALESRSAAMAHQVDDILRSRIWRTLRSAGALLLAPRSLLGSSRPAPPLAASPAAPQHTPAVEDDFCGLVCDVPLADDDTAHTGKLPVRGWALTRSGVSRVEVRLAGAAVSALLGEARPDIARSFPEVPGSRTAGFLAEIDTTGVPDGLHFLSIRAASCNGSGREWQVPVRIDHVSGYGSEYDRWIAEFETQDRAVIPLRLRMFTQKPLISILLPVYRTPLKILKRTIDSVLAQSYANWELCIADDGSQTPAIEELLRDYAGKDRRIRLSLLPKNGGISQASEACRSLATGDFVALLDHDDELAPDALFDTVEAINLQPGIDLLYSDEDKIDEYGRRYDPFFKPDWSPDLLLSENYICHLLVVRRSLLEQVGGFRPGFDGSQDYDLLLRLTDQTNRIAHIPRILYHWRSLPSSTASSSQQKTYAIDAAQRSIQEALERRGNRATVVSGAFPGRWRVRYALAQAPAVSIVIAAGGKVEVLRDNLTSLFGKTEYGNYEVVVIDNAKHDRIERLVATWPNAPRPLRYLDWRNKPFNYSAINNQAARNCASPILLFLNDDTTVIAPGWLDAMVELAARPEVGAVGAKLLYPEGQIQHAGVVMGLFENCGHAFKGLPGDRQHYFDLPDVIRNVSAVTGACLMTRAEVFHEVGGFDEHIFAVAFNDIDFCLRIGQKGHRVLYTPHALLHHYEAFSKTPADLIPHPEEVRAMQEKWQDVIAADPFYNPNLTRTAEDYSLRRKTLTPGRRLPLSKQGTIRGTARLDDHVAGLPRRVSIGIENPGAAPENADPSARVGDNRDAAR